MINLKLSYELIEKLKAIRIKDFTNFRKTNAQIRNNILN